MATYSSSKERILRALSAGPLHGYGIIKAVELTTGGKVRLAVGTLYGSLDALERDGLVARDRNEVVKGRNRKYFRITEGGLSQVAKWEARVARKSRTEKKRSELGRAIPTELAT